MRINAKRTHRLSFRTEAKSTQTKHDGLPAPHISPFFSPWDCVLFRFGSLVASTLNPLFLMELYVGRRSSSTYFYVVGVHTLSHIPSKWLYVCVCAGVQTTQFDSEISVPADFTEHMEERVHPHALVYSSFNLIFRSCFNHQACSAVHVHRTFACTGGREVRHEAAVSRSVSRTHSTVVKLYVNFRNDKKRKRSLSCKRPGMFTHSRLQGPRIGCKLFGIKIEIIIIESIIRLLLLFCKRKIETETWFH